MHFFRKTSGASGSGAQLEENVLAITESLKIVEDTIEGLVKRDLTFKLRWLLSWKRIRTFAQDKQQ